MELGDGFDMTSGFIHYPDHSRSELEACASFWRALSLVCARNSGMNPQNALWLTINTSDLVCSARKRRHTEV